MFTRSFKENVVEKKKAGFYGVLSINLMEMRKLIFCISVLIVALLANSAYCQYNPLGQENSFMQLDRQRGAIIMSSAALGSFLISKFLTNDVKIDYYQAHVGYFYGYSGGGWGPSTQESTKTAYSIFMESFGAEREYSRWFSLRFEGTIQEMSGEDYFTAGGGIKLYTKWTILRKKKLHPYIEYGGGVFCALQKFPEDGSLATFNLNYAIGAEYILPNNDKIMLDANFKHHSNNNLGDSNPGFDGNGVSLSYCWFWKEKKNKVAQ